MRSITASLSTLIFFISFATYAQSQRVDDEQISIRSYARSALISEAEAARRLKLQESSAATITNILARHDERLAGAFWEDTPEFRFVIRLKGDQPVKDAAPDIQKLDVPIVFITGASNTKKELEYLIKVHRASLFEAIPDLQGIFVDERTGYIVLHIYPTDDDKDTYLKAVPELTKLMGTPVQIRFLPGPMRPAVGQASTAEENAYVRGGSILQGSNGSQCTGGFIVKHPTTSRFGLLTAGHCPDKMTYYNWQPYYSGDQVVASLNMEAQLWDQTHDLQWHTFPAFGYTPLREVYGEFTTEGSGRSITYTGSASVGHKACHRGVNTGYSCGTVASTNYSFKPGSCNGNDCDESAFQVIMGDDLACFGADSGGPVISGKTAYGIVSAAAWAGPDPGQCGAIAFMPIGQIHDAGLSIY